VQQRDLLGNVEYAVEAAGACPVMRAAIQNQTTRASIGPGPLLRHDLREAHDIHHERSEIPRRAKPRHQYAYHVTR